MDFFLWLQSEGVHNSIYSIEVSIIRPSRNPQAVVWGRPILGCKPFIFIATKEVFFMHFQKNRKIVFVTSFISSIHVLRLWIELEITAGRMLVGVWIAKYFLWFCMFFPLNWLTSVLPFSSTARQIQRASGIRTNVWSAVVRPSGGLREREEPRAFHTQHSARLLLLLQVTILWCLQAFFNGHLMTFESLDSLLASNPIWSI